MTDARVILRLAKHDPVLRLQLLARRLRVAIAVHAEDPLRECMREV